MNLQNLDAVLSFSLTQVFQQLLEDKSMYQTDLYYLPWAISLTERKLF